jgi:DNA (cytosine-5)-methyltransferase 1
MNIYFVDLFCGAGGVTQGLHNAIVRGKKIVKVVACVNHDPKAIKSHYLNHKETRHFTEDIRTLDILELIEMVREIRRKDSTGLICLWASLECTNFSKAKGGQPRDADSRTLAEHLYRYLEGLDPDYMFIENVEEFMSWGPLDDKGKPISKKLGEDYVKWRDHVKSYGYEFDYRILNSADYGAHTSRKRFFGLFARPDLPLIFPEPTHAKLPKEGVLTNLKRWKAVKEVLDFTDEGKSIFNRKKDLSLKTMERIYAGLIKYVAGGKDNFIQKYYSGRPKGKVTSTDDPIGTVTTFANQSIVRCSFLHKYHGTGANIISEDEPSSTLTTKDRLALVRPIYWLDKCYSGPSNHSDVESPAGTIMTKDKYSLVKIKGFIFRQFSNGGEVQSLENPGGSLMTVPKMNLVNLKWLMSTNFNNVGSSIDNPSPVITANRKHHYLMNPVWNNIQNHSVNNPSPTIIAGQDKAPLYLVSTSAGRVIIAVYDTDSDIVVKIKEFMVLYDITDIKMRMLKVFELLRIQGFPEGYQLFGNQADQKKFIGNSVTPVIPERWISCLYEEFETLKAAA